MLSTLAGAAPMGFDEARHLLARTGFGPTDAEIRGYAALTREQGVNLVLRDVRTRSDHAAARLHAGNVRAALSARRHGDARRAPRLPAAADPPGPRASRVVDARDAGDALAHHRAHDAVLAQPLRVEPAEGALLAAHVPAERDAARARARQLRRSPARGVEGPRDAHLPRHRAEPQGPAQRELRARGHGALHARRRPLRRSGRQGGRARVHRMEPRSRHRALPLPARHPRLRREDRARQVGPVRRRRRARRHPRSAANRGVHHGQAVARVRVRRPRPARSAAHRARRFATATTTSRSRCARCF